MGDTIKPTQEEFIASRQRAAQEAFKFSVLGSNPFTGDTDPVWLQRDSARFYKDARTRLFAFLDSKPNE